MGSQKRQSLHRGQPGRLRTARLAGGTARKERTTIINLSYLKSGCNTLQGRFEELLATHIQRLKIHGDKAIGLAPCHEDTRPSFTADLTKCVYYCFTCGAGGGVRDFAQLVGEEWDSLRRNSHGNCARRQKRRALEAVRKAYRDWQRRRYIELTDELHQLRQEKEIAAIAYQHLLKNPERFTDKQYHYWTDNLAKIVDRIVELEDTGLLDLFIGTAHESERFALWRAEVSHV